VSDEESLREIRWRRRKWRRKWIAKFAARQRFARRWISFVDLADWCARSTTAASLDDEAKAQEVAYQRLADSVRKGEFDRGGRSKILYLDTVVMRCRLTREQFEIAFVSTATPPAPSLPLTVLNCCWVSCDLARKWLESHSYRWSPHFEPERKAASDNGPGISRVNPVRPHAVENLRATDPVPFMPTGAPGRPSKGMYIIRAEFDRRRAASDCKPSLREEATELESWFRNCYPTAQAAKPKTIENNIRSDYRNWASSRRSPEH
jgi:hypothetical protein